MQVIQTASVQLVVDPYSKEFSTLLNTIKNYTDAYNFNCALGFDKHIANGIKLHKLTYLETREKFNLPAQLAISARSKAIASLKTVFKAIKKNEKPGKVFHAPHSKRNSILLDQNSHTLKADKHQLSVLTCDGRIKVDIKLNSYFELYSKDPAWKKTSATLKFKNNKFYLLVQFEKDITDLPRTGKHLGIDRGIKKLAVTSDNIFYGGGQVRKIQERYAKLRKKLQEKGTRSAKRHLKKISGEEKRFKADVNHNISKQIIASLNPGDTIVLEDLSGIRNKRKGKRLNTQINSWNFYQLETFLTYKGLAKNIDIVYVDARYTSQRCSECGHICRSNRKSQSGFECKHCGFKLNADLNAARNIVLKHLDARRLIEAGGYPERAKVDRPIVSEMTWPQAKSFSGTSPRL